MAQSVRFKALRRRIQELISRFLPSAFSPTGVYSAEELDKARAFRMLAHAEIEHFLEDRALDIADAAFNLFKIASRASRPLVHILTNVVGEQDGLPSKLGTQRTALTIAGRGLGQYKHKMLHNNGIRTDNLLQILLPVGVLESELDVAWLSTTDGFGAKRGLTAHTSAITHAVDPQDDHQTVQQIMTGMADVDELLNEIKRRIRWSDCINVRLLSARHHNVSNSPMAEGDPIRIISHREVDDDCGSLEVWFADGRQSIRFYWDNRVSRRLNPNTVTRQEAVEEATALARTEIDKLNNPE